MQDFLETIAESLQSDDERDGRIYGFVYGVVTDVADPKNLGRVRARIMAQHDHDSSDWLLPLWPGAIESVPRVNDPIVACFIDGDPNRGMYAGHATTRMLGRATEAMLLASTFIRLYNDLVSKFNNLKLLHNTHTHTSGGSGSPTTVPNGNSGSANHDADADAAFGLRADGSQPGPLASSSKVLSGEAKVR